MLPRRHGAALANVGCQSTRYWPRSRSHNRDGDFFCQANSAAPTSVKRTQVPLSSSSSQPLAITQSFVKNWRGAGSSDISSRDDLEEGSDDDTQELCEPSQQQAEVVAGRGENGVDAVAEASLEIISVHAVLGLDVADDGLDSRATLHLATDGSGDAADLTRDPDPEAMRVVVTAIPFVDVDTASLHAGELLHVGNHGTERVTIEGIAMQGLGVEHELAALRRRHGGGDADLAAELVGRAGFTFADALDLRSM